ncbi:MAG: D-alanyl-D-alanine carboxypeptidase [Firmicutes bacterium]|nr:D-alanyl-D-alanine carboxypeptidase [Bacillota bacterium]
MDAATGQVLYGKNEHQERPPASTTKMMTALLAVEGGDLSRVVTVSEKAASVGEASIDLRAGEKISLEDLVYGAMLESGNDACVAIAESIAGTEANFVLFMNQKAKLLGARHTQYKNPNGLPLPGHYSTAYDLALIARHALNNPLFARVAGTREKVIGLEYKRLAVNTNGLLWGYPGADGVKTGTTNEAGRCLVASATRDGRRLISVVLHSDDRYGDCAKLLDYGFNCFETVRAVEKGAPLGEFPVAGGSEPVVRVLAADDVTVVIPKGASGVIEKTVRVDGDLAAPVAAGQRVGRVDVSVGGVTAGSAPLITAAGVAPRAQGRFFFQRRG